MVLQTGHHCALAELQVLSEHENDVTEGDVLPRLLLMFNSLGFMHHGVTLREHLLLLIPAHPPMKTLSNI